MKKTILAIQTLAFAAVLFLMPLAAHAQVVTFAQFVQDLGGQDFTFVNNNGTSGTFSTVPSGADILFRYQNISDLPAELQGFQNATLSITSETFTPSTDNAGSITQPLDSTTVIQIIRDTPTSPGVGTGTRRNLLTIFLGSASSTPILNGSNGGNSGTLQAATPTTVVNFSSDFVSFANTTQRAAALSFSSVVPSFTRGAGGFLQNFTAAGTGTFSSNPPPLFVQPTAADATIQGRVVTSRGRGIGRANVSITDAQGVTRSVTTNNFGNFTIGDVRAGQSYIIDVRARGYTFNSQVISVDDDLADLQILPNK